RPRGRGAGPGSGAGAGRSARRCGGQRPGPAAARPRVVREQPDRPMKLAVLSDAEAVDQLRASGVVPVAVTARGDEAAEARARALGIADVLPDDADASVAAA